MGRGSVKRHDRQPAALANQAIDGGAARLLECVARKPIFEWRQFLVRFAGELCQCRIITLTTRPRQQFSVDCNQSIEEFAPRTSAKAPDLRAAGIQFTNDRLQHGIEGRGSSGAKRRQTSDDTIQVRGQQLVPARSTFWAFGLGPVAGASRSARLVRNSDCAPPFVERVEDVRLAKLNPHRSASRPFRVIPFEVAIDSVIGDAYWHTLRGPLQHLLEGGTDDSNQVAVVLLAEIRLDRPAVLIRGFYSHRTSPDLILSVPSAPVTISAPSLSMFSASPV